MAEKGKLDQVLNRFWDWTLKNNPTCATFVGDKRFNHLLPEISQSAIEQRRKELKDFQAEHGLIDKSKLTGEDFISWDTLGLKIEQSLKMIDYKFYEWELDQISGPQLELFEIINFQPMKDQKDLDDLLNRYKLYPKYIEDYISNLRVGSKQGKVAPKIAHERIIDQLKALLSVNATESPLYTPAKQFQSEAAKVKKHIEDYVYPALKNFQAFLTQEYKSREEVGISAIKDGKAAYEFLCNVHTTTSLKPQEIHEIGLSELASIHSEMKTISKTEDIKGFNERIKNDPSNFLKTKEELIAGFEKYLDKCNKKLPQFFGRLPKAKCIVKPIEEYREKDSPAAFYYSPDQDFTRPGIFYANAYKPELRPKYNMAALTVHEAVPGHHLQIALALEITGLPKFRKHSHFTAFTEGWGLYSERLGDEMGMYEDDLSRYGMLTYQAWRAVRLVVDTGMHYLGWSRDKAIKFFQDNLSITEPEVIAEINRYIIWPGQALAYKIGQQEIERLRKECSKRLGSRFDIRSFHDELLCHGSIPLSTLAKIMTSWQQAANIEP